MAQIPISLQLYSVRDDAKADLASVLAQVAAMGYTGVEFAGFYGHDAESVRAMLDATGLQVAGAHVHLNLLLGAVFDETVAFHKTIGNRFLIVPGLQKEHTETRASWLATAATMNEIAARLAPHGMLTGYHNHHTEFTELDGELPWDTFFGNTNHEVVMQFDTGNALMGGADAPPFLARYPGRALTVHLKEYSATDETALIGAGDVPWQTIFDLCETTGATQWYIVEQESYAHPPLECVARCLANLRAMGK